MKKIPTFLERDWEGDRSRVLDRVVPGCEWVAAGEGVATRKYDGTCVMFDGTAWWARREIKEGKAAPQNFVAEESDAETGKTVGWEPVDQSPFYKFWDEAVAAGGYVGGSDNGSPHVAEWPAGTYELCGPKIQGNPEGFGSHVLVRHETAYQLLQSPRTWDGLYGYFPTC